MLYVIPFRHTYTAPPTICLTGRANLNAALTATPATIRAYALFWFFLALLMFEVDQINPSCYTCIPPRVGRFGAMHAEANASERSAHIF